MEHARGPLPQGPAVRLANNGPPLLPLRHPSQFTGAGQQTAFMAGRDAHLGPREEYVVKPPKHDFPRFDGDAPRIWLERCLSYFELYRVPQHSWVATAGLYMDGLAAMWLQAYKQTHPALSWPAFRTAVEAEFGPEEFEAQMHQLVQLRQTGSVQEYRQQFETSMYHLLSLDPTLSTQFFISQFLLGLKDELRLGVRLQPPTSITRAAVFARIQEEELEKQRLQRPRIVPVGRPPPATTNTNQARAAPPPRPGGDEYTRERQLRDFRRANGLCFRCGDKYSREHQCKRTGQILMIEVGDFGEILSDDTVHALQLLDEPALPEPECCTLSQHAISGEDAPSTVRLRAQVGDQVMLLLVDSGSSHSFVSEAFIQHIAADTQPLLLVSVRVGNGQRLHCNKMVKQLAWQVPGHTFHTDLRVLQLSAYDAVLGMDWLSDHSPMNCHWKLKRISFETEGKTVQLQGVRTTNLSPRPYWMLMNFTEWRSPMTYGQQLWSLSSRQRKGILNRYLPGFKKCSLNIKMCLLNPSPCLLIVSMTTAYTWSQALHPSTPNHTATRQHRKMRSSSKCKRCCNQVSLYTA